MPQPGDVGHDTWEGDSWKGRLGANAWPFYFTLDEQRGLLYLPLASPIPGAYGGDRKGANLFGNSVVAVDVQTGKYRWHFQTIHHDLWDADPPAPPGLFDIVRNGRTIPALALTTKSGYLYILNRETGQPIFGVEERPVAEERRARRGGVSDAADSGEAAADRARQLQAGGSRHRRRHDARTREGLRGTGREDRRRRTTPARSRRGCTAREGAPPRTHAGVPGRARRRELGRHRVRSQHRLRLRGHAGRRRARLDGEGPGGLAASLRQEHSGRRPGAAPSTSACPAANWPCQKPPWGRLTAVNASTGDIAWQMPLGITEQLPEGKQHTGRPALAGPIVTAGGVLFIASTDDNRFRALDAKTGKRTVGDQARAARQRRSDHLSGQQRQAVRGGRRHRHAGGLRAAVDVRNSATNGPND